MSHARLLPVGLLVFVLVLAVMAVSAAACSGGGGGKEPTELTTSLSATSVLEGTGVTDKATLSGNNVSKATGKVKYYVYSDSSCIDLVTTAGEGTVSGETVTASSEEVLEAGNAYYWQATYEGNESNDESTSTCGSEILDVKAKTSLATKLYGEGQEGEELTTLEGSKAEDTATLSGTNSVSAGGKVQYKIYSDKECKTLVTEAGEVTVAFGSIPASSEEALEGGNTYYWQAHYKGDSLHQESTSVCGKEVLKVKAASSLSTQLHGEGKEGEALAVQEETAVHDTATLSGTNSSNAGGTVKYKIYSNEACTELVTEAGEVAVTGGTVPASSNETLSAGTYYWQAAYSGDALHQASTSACGSEGQVVAATTEVATSLSNGTTEGAEIEVAEGESVLDTATLSGKNISLATGTVTYSVYSDSECTELVGSADAETVTEGVASPSLSRRLPAGTYYWQAVYSGDTQNQSSASSCGSEIEVVNAPAVTTSLSGEEETGETLEVQEGAEVSDTATLHAENPSTATGTVTYSVYSDSECTELVASAGEVTIESGGKVPASNKENLSTGTYFWQASYSGDSSHKAASSVCGTELHIVADSISITTSLSGEEKSGETLEVQERAAVTDAATLHGSKASTATGTVTYNVYSDSKCEHLYASAGEVTVTSGSVPQSLEESLPAGTYYWQAVYTGDTSNQPSTSTCEAEVETVAGLTTSLHGGEERTGEVLEVPEETPVIDTATLHGSSASTATGAVEYNVYSDNECEHLVVSAGEGTMTEGVASESQAETLEPGTYYWQAYYKGDESHPSRKSACGNEEEIVTKKPQVWVVSVGDSYISGEGGRWAGNTVLNKEWREIDALGNEAYYGEPNGEPGKEEVPLCHRSKSAEIFIGGVRSKNLACSGAETLSASQDIKRRWVWWGPVTGGVFKPGLDFVKVNKGQTIKEGTGPNRGPCPLTECVGQAKKLEEFAKTRKENGEQVKMVVVSIGGNDFEFGEIIEECVEAYAFPLIPLLNEECRKARGNYFEKALLEEKEKAIEDSVNRVGQAMENAGFAKNEYTIVIQDYPSPIPGKAAEFRYTEGEKRILTGPIGWIRPWGAGPVGLAPSREVMGACPFRDKDAEWANTTALKKIDEAEKGAFKKVEAGNKYQVAFMELEGAFSPNANEPKGRRLCEKSLTLIGGENFFRGAPLNWRVPLALKPLKPRTVNETEWINQLRIRTWNLWGISFGILTPFLIQEDMHPNFWGQLALRNCLRKEYNNGAPKNVGTCIIEKPGLTAVPGGPPPAVKDELPLVRNEPLMELK